MGRRHLFDFKTNTNACGADESGLQESSFLQEHPANRCKKCESIVMERTEATTTVASQGKSE